MNDTTPDDIELKINEYITMNEAFAVQSVFATNNAHFRTSKLIRNRFFTIHYLVYAWVFIKFQKKIYKLPKLKKAAQINGKTQRITQTIQRNTLKKKLVFVLKLMIQQKCTCKKF